MAMKRMMFIARICFTTGVFSKKRMASEKFFHLVDGHFADNFLAGWGKLGILAGEEGLKQFGGVPLRAYRIGLGGESV